MCIKKVIWYSNLPTLAIIYFYGGISGHLRDLRKDSAKSAELNILWYFNLAVMTTLWISSSLFLEATELSTSCLDQGGECGPDALSPFKENPSHQLHSCSKLAKQVDIHDLFLIFPEGKRKRALAVPCFLTLLLFEGLNQEVSL